MLTIRNCSDRQVSRVRFMWWCRSVRTDNHTFALQLLYGKKVLQLSIFIYSTKIGMEDPFSFAAWKRLDIFKIFYIYFSLNLSRKFYFGPSFLIIEYSKLFVLFLQVLSRDNMTNLPPPSRRLPRCAPERHCTTISAEYFSMKIILLLMLVYLKN